jgi:hypothetical protein
LPKIVILGSCRFAPYEVLAVPEKIPGAWNTEAGYQMAFRRFGPAIRQADIVVVYAPDGIGVHTNRDLEYAKSLGKRIHIIGGPKA